MPLSAPQDIRCPSEASPVQTTGVESSLARITALAAACLGLPMAWLSLGTGQTRTVRAAHGLDGRMPGVAADGFHACAALMGADGNRLGELWVGDERPRLALDATQTAQLAAFAELAAEKLDQAARTRTDEFVRGFAEAAVYALMTADAEGTITFVNQAAGTLFGYEPEAMIGRTFDFLFPASLQASYRETFAKLANDLDATALGHAYELVGLHRDGTAFPIEFSLSVWRENGRIGVGATMRDISEWRIRDAQLVRMAHFDSLTGLANRARFLECVAAALAEGPATVIKLDLDNFKDVHDGFGHATGDALLRAVAARLSAHCAAVATVARLSGERFALLVPACGDPIRATALARRVVDAFEETFEVVGHTFRVGLCLGLAIGTHPGTDANTLITDADLALYQAKNEGRRGIRLFEPAMRSAVIARRTLHDEIGRALAAGELVMHYQPQVAFATGQIVGAEALLRWRHPTRGLLLPGMFLSTLEAHPMAADIGGWIIEETCRQAAQWRAAGLPPIRIAVNLFAAQLRAGTLTRDVRNALARYRMAPSDFEIEVTERIALQADDATLESIHALHAEGVAVAFDDFGTGYASLASLKRFPLTRLKIDRSFVRDVLNDRHDAQIIRAILLMAQSFGLDVIAEGIETEGQEAILREMGCHEGQGYLYGKALPPAALAALIRTRAIREPREARANPRSA
ncbi:putative bifunctional diguanylate cyclase/phosphodiesterase [Methylobacterium gossipiicola]|uniref:PAS domain S-box-containing protein/diguanylate cyclase (GGDEF) domain-containing protein n=1 Tax=Methylobacterium gossipiicola TaxID=582675 RepID=A0A1I2T984_9HYPH|nr:EAL domain-containing protein [Methylobacterium gossipiicola]SFG59797.1 PAS domain S-box-containing protein/diguanylate cyclase (GGDEF) domain-containing protein [Methylobacterium gossipiicola]